MTLESIEKLREWVQHIDENRQLGALAGSGKQGLINIADEIQAEIDSRYMELPVDADGVPIRVNDVMVDCRTPRNVVAVAPDSFVMCGYETDSFYRAGRACNHRHYRKPRTVEDVLHDFGNDYAAFLSGIYPFENARQCELIAKYAAELRMAGDAE